MVKYTACEALEAILARINGEWDNPQLVKFGPLATGMIEDIRDIAAAVIPQAINDSIEEYSLIIGELEVAGHRAARNADTRLADIIDTASARARVVLGRLLDQRDQSRKDGE